MNVEHFPNWHGARTHIRSRSAEIVDQFEMRDTRRGKPFFPHYGQSKMTGGTRTDRYLGWPVKVRRRRAFVRTGPFHDICTRFHFPVLIPSAMPRNDQRNCVGASNAHRHARKELRFLEKNKSCTTARIPDWLSVHNRRIEDLTVPFCGELANRLSTQKSIAEHTK